MEDRNPSPPPEVEEEPDVYLPDIVGDTVISKHWVLTTLMDLINVSVVCIYCNLISCKIHKTTITFCCFLSILYMFIILDSMVKFV